MLPGGIRYKIRLAKQFAQLNQNIRDKNREGCLKTIYDIESLFIKTNKDYGKNKENGERRPLTEAFIV